MLTVSAGEKVVGEFHCAPNARNNRDLDIIIDWEHAGEKQRAEFKM